MIKRRSMIGSGAGGAAVAIGTAGLATPALAQQTFRLRLQSWTWPALEQHRAVQEWVQRVAQLTNNRLQIELCARGGGAALGGAGRGLARAPGCHHGMARQLGVARCRLQHLHAAADDDG
jgi:hypothetical protein